MCVRIVGSGSIFSWTLGHSDIKIPKVWTKSNNVKAGTKLKVGASVKAGTYLKLCMEGASIILAGFVKFWTPHRP